MRRFLFDTAVFVYARGKPHAYRDPCSTVVADQAAGRLAGEAAIGLIPEYAHHRYRQTRDRWDAIQMARDVAAICKLHATVETDVIRALELYERHPRLDSTDAVFAAVALNRGIDAVLTPDRAFDGISGLERIDPLDGDAVAALGR
jgi:predicted nucleic acid-binding protein